MNRQYISAIDQLVNVAAHVEVDDLPLATTLERALDDLVRNLEESGVNARKIEVGVFAQERDARGAQGELDEGLDSTHDQGDPGQESSAENTEPKPPRILGPNRGSVVNVVV